MNFLGQIQTESFWIKNCFVTISSPLVSPIFFSQTGHHQSVECSLISLFVQYYYSNLYIDHCHEHVSWTVAIHNILHQKSLAFYFSSIKPGLQSAYEIAQAGPQVQLLKSAHAFSQALWARVLYYSNLGVSPRNFIGTLVRGFYTIDNVHFDDMQ